MKCKPYSEITVEIRTQLKTVKNTSNIFAVQSNRLYKISTRSFQPQTQKTLCIQCQTSIKVFSAVEKFMIEMSVVEEDFIIEKCLVES